MLPRVRVDGLIVHTIGWTIDVMVVRLWTQFDDNGHSIIKMICSDEQVIYILILFILIFYA